MKAYTFPIVFLLASFIPFAAHGQQAIIDAFDAIINCKKAKIEASHSMQRDMDTGVKIGQSDIYDFELSKKQRELLDNALKAFDQDSQLAYLLKSGDNMESGRNVVLAVGDGKGTNATLTTEDCRYIYACFLAPKEEDAEGNYRYAYGISYEDIDPDDDEICGRILVTYASTMKHRQDNSGLNSLRELSQAETWTNNANFNQVQSWANESKNSTQTEPWIRVFIKYVTAMGYSNKHTRATNAGYLYEVSSSIDKYKDVSEQDKETARGILKALIEDPNNNDPVVHQILKNALANIK